MKFIKNYFLIIISNLIIKKKFSSIVTFEEII